MEEEPYNTFELRQFLTGFCYDKVGSVAHAGICSCFFPDAFYDDLRDHIAKFYDVPANLISQGKQCIFPACHNSRLKDDPEALPCQAFNLQQCIQTVNITTTGDITNVIVKQDSVCGDIRRRDTCDPPCVAPEQCVAGVCLDPTKCTQDNDCGVNGDKECKDGVCVDKKTNWMKRIGIFLGVVALICICFGIYKLFKTRAAQAAKRRKLSAPSVQ
jgi:hypothetical protein